MTVAVSTVETAGYVGEAAALASRLIEIEENVEAVFVLAQMDSELYLIGRSHTGPPGRGRGLEGVGRGRPRPRRLRACQIPEPKPAPPSKFVDAIRERLLERAEERILEEPHAAETTKPIADVTRGAAWPMRGLNPAAWQAAVVASMRPVPGGP